MGVTFYVSILLSMKNKQKILIETSYQYRGTQLMYSKVADVVALALLSSYLLNLRVRFDCLMPVYNCYKVLICEITWIHSRRHGIFD